MGRRLFVSRKCNLEYLELPKCACTSIKVALLNHDGIQPRYQEIDNESHWQFEPPDKPEITTRFTFVRHPINRFISAYREKVQAGYLEAYDLLPRTTTPLAFANWVASYLQEIKGWPAKHFCPQVVLLNNRLRVSEDTLIGKVENIVEDWLQLQVRFSLPDLKHLNGSRGEVRLTDETIAKV